MLSIPFATDDVHGGFSEGRGTVRVDGDDVVLEVQVKVFGMFEQTPRTFRFHLTDLESVEHSRGVFRDVVTLRTQPMNLATQVPGAADGRLRLKVKRRHRADVDALLDRLDLWIVE